eukprot:m.143655 g.143655  ORF g.143655 m.143655 type:complete len:66 (-) comp17702_c0_seq5:131-328(-)
MHPQLCLINNASIGSPVALVGHVVQQAHGQKQKFPSFHTVQSTWPHRLMPFIQPSTPHPFENMRL